MMDWLLNYFAQDFWSWVINIWFVVVMWMTGNKQRSGWLWGLGLQVIWVAYALTTKQYGFIIGVVAVTVIYLRNWMEWGKPEVETYAKTIGDQTEFTIKVRMKTRWVPQFLGMLAYMQQLGELGSSRRVTLYVDGDGDFQPKFEWCPELPKAEREGREDTFGNRFFDAG